MKTRRDFLKGGSVLAAAGVVGLPSIGHSADQPIQSNTSNGEPILKLGVASYSLRKLDKPTAIAAVQALNTPYMNLKSMHQPYEGDAESWAAGKKEIEDAGLMVVGGGNITLAENDEADMRKYFEYAKHSGMEVMVCSINPEGLALAEKLAIEYDRKMAIHNHGPEDKWYPAPSDVLEMVKDMDTRLGCCIDIGHTARTGKDVVEEIEKTMAAGRLHDLHVKDLADMMVRDSQVIVGHGKMPIPDIFRTLIRNGFTGCANLEYEIDADNPLPGMKESFAYMRGVLAGILT